VAALVALVVAQPARVHLSEIAIAPTRQAARRRSGFNEFHQVFS